MGSKKALLLIFSAVILVSFIFMVSAVTINPTLPAINNTNISGTYTLNATVLGAANDAYLGNATFWYQHWSYIGNH